VQVNLAGEWVNVIEINTGPLRCVVSRQVQQPCNRGLLADFRFSLLIRCATDDVATDVLTASTQDAAATAPDESDAAKSVSDAAGLLRVHPHWAVWLPGSGGRWTAVRPLTSRPPGPELPMLWVHADTSSELGRLMRDADEQISRGA
jgi:hypothetical protein